jgi:hypothetical protein
MSSNRKKLQRERAKAEKRLRKKRRKPLPTARVHKA